MSETCGYAKKIESLIEQRDSLRALNAELIEALEFIEGVCMADEPRDLPELVQYARAAIASARKQGDQG